MALDISRRKVLGTAMIGSAGLVMGSTAAPAQTPAPAAVPAASVACSASSILDSVMERKKVVVGIRNDAGPFGAVDRDGKNTGFGPDIAQEIAKALGVAADLRVVTVTNRVPLIQTGGVDVVIDSALITRERWKVIDFSLTYYLDYTGNRMITKKDSAIEGYEGIAKKKVGVVQGSLGINRIQKNAPTAELVYFQDYPSAVLAVKRGRVDAMYAMDTIVTESMKNDRDNELRITEPLLAEQNYGMLLRQNDAKWRNQVNFILIDLWLSGTYTTLFRKAFNRNPDKAYSLPSWEA